MDEHYIDYLVVWLERTHNVVADRKAVAAWVLYDRRRSVCQSRR